MGTPVDPIHAVAVLKRDGGVRLLARLSDRDAARWHAVAGRAGLAVEASLPSNVLADRVVAGRGGWRLAPVAPALARGRRLAGRLAAASGLVATDVENFFGSVTSDTLGRTLRAAGVAREDADLAAAMVAGWEEAGHRGLPVGPPGSSLLANAVLLPVDRRLAGWPFLRWVDDYLLAAPALEAFDEALAGVGLRRSRAKTVQGVAGVWAPPYVLR